MTEQQEVKLRSRLLRYVKETADPKIPQNQIYEAVDELYQLIDNFFNEIHPRSFRRNKPEEPEEEITF